MTDYQYAEKEAIRTIEQSGSYENGLPNPIYYWPKYSLFRKIILMRKPP